MAEANARNYKTALMQEYPLIMPYQISLEHSSTGKHIGFTKRRFRCKFGFAHIGSVLKGMIGVDCRGLEMEVQLIWSVTGGKYSILFNHQVIHRSDRNTAVGLNKNSDNQKSLTRVEHRFRIPDMIFPGGHTIHIAAHSFSRENQFELKLDGQNYLEFLPMYELGLPSMHNFYGHSLQAIRSKYQQQPNSIDNTTATVTMANNHNHGNNNGGNPVDLLVEGRPRYMPGTSSNKKSSSQTTTPANSTHNNDSVYYKSSDLPVARSFEEEQQMVAQARLASLQDVRPSHNNIHAAFSTNQRAQTRPLPAVAESNADDFIDLTSYAPPMQYSAPSAFPVPPNRPDLLRSTSSLTNDFDDDNTISYDHLDPTKVFQTQQNMHISFKFQTAPPTYADSQMGDITMNQSAAPSNYNNIHRSNHFAAPPPSMNNYPPSVHSSMPVQNPNLYGAAPPPPTWEDLNMTNNSAAPPPPTWEDLSNNYSHSMSFAKPPQQQQQQQQPNSNYNNFAAPPPLHSNNW